MLLWMDYAEELLTEWKQCMEEGLDISAYKELMEQIQKMPPSPERYRLADEMSSLLQTLPHQKDYTYDEPSDWDGIQACLPKEQPVLPGVPNREALSERIHGAWLGRIIGCLLGKPVEGRRTPD